ncbi:hypothetical protein, partial [Psychrosphaera aestuarii]
TMCEGFFIASDLYPTITARYFVALGNCYFVALGNCSCVALTPASMHARLLSINVLSVAEARMYLIYLFFRKCV